MKKECSDKTAGSLLHAYELDMLSTDETEQFEIHLLKCEYCHEQISQLSDVTQMMVFDNEIVNKINNFGEEPVLSKFSKLFKMKTQFLSKPILSAMVVCFLFVTYFGYDYLTNSLVESSQQIRLFPQRSSTDNVKYLSTDQPLEIVFGFEGSIVNSCYLIEIFDEDNSIIFEDKSFCDFNALNLGKVEVASDFLEKGHYKMIITDFSSSLSSNSQEYRFTISYK